MGKTLTILVKIFCVLYILISVTGIIIVSGHYPTWEECKGIWSIVLLFLIVCSPIDLSLFARTIVSSWKLYK